MVFAWPGPPDVTSAGKPAGARCGVPGTFALGGNEPQASRHFRTRKEKTDAAILPPGFYIVCACTVSGLAYLRVAAEAAMMRSVRRLDEADAARASELLRSLG
jgi:hypothetical protein